MDDLRWWTVPGNVTAAVAARLPGALIGAVMLVVFAGILGPTWGGAVALGWLAAGALLLTRPGEHAAATTVLRYRPEPRLWLAADVGRLAPGHRIDVYVAPKAAGVFALAVTPSRSGSGPSAREGPPRPCGRRRCRRWLTCGPAGPARSWRWAGGAGRGCLPR